MNRRKFLGGLAILGPASAAVTSIVKMTVPVEVADRGNEGGIVANFGGEARRRQLFQDMNIPVWTHEGKQALFYDDLIKDKTVIIQLMYTSDEDRSAKATANLSALQGLLGDRLGRDVFMYSITQDPDRDTPDVLANYARRFEAQPGWLFLTTQGRTAAANVANFLCATTVKTNNEEGRDDFTAFLKIGVEPLERWGCAPALVRPEVLALHLSWVEPGPHQ